MEVQKISHIIRVNRNIILVDIDQLLEEHHHNYSNYYCDVKAERQFCLSLSNFRI